jgi:hypothetical protein
VADGDVSARRRALRDDVTRLAAALGRAVVEAEAVGLPVEPGIRRGRDALTHWGSCSKTSSPKPASNR